MPFFEKEDTLADKPRTPLFRAFLPEHVDLSGRIPTAGHHGRQSSCVGWAVGYATRSYYDSEPDGGRYLTADQIPSPAYIYDSIRKHRGILVICGRRHQPGVPLTSEKTFHVEKHNARN